MNKTIYKALKNVNTPADLRTILEGNDTIMNAFLDNVDNVMALLKEMEEIYAEILDDSRNYAIDDDSESYWDHYEEEYPEVDHYENYIEEYPAIDTDLIATVDIMEDVCESYPWNQN